MYVYSYKINIQSRHHWRGVCKVYASPLTQNCTNYLRIKKKTELTQINKNNKNVYAGHFSETLFKQTV